MIVLEDNRAKYKKLVYADPKFQELMRCRYISGTDKNRILQLFIWKLWKCEYLLHRRAQGLGVYRIFYPKWTARLLQNQHREKYRWVFDYLSFCVNVRGVNPSGVLKSPIYDSRFTLGQRLDMEQSGEICLQDKSSHFGYVTYTMKLVYRSSEKTYWLLHNHPDIKKNYRGTIDDFLPISTYSLSNGVIFYTIRYRHAMRILKKHLPDLVRQYLGRPRYPSGRLGLYVRQSLHELGMEREESLESR
jgi:hypothetical protein